MRARVIGRDVTGRTPEDYEVIRVPKDCIPEGARLVEAYETATEIVVCGDPPPEHADHCALTDYAGDSPGKCDCGFDEEKAHNCDQMGCGTLSHVVYRFRKGEAEKAFDLLERAVGMMEHAAPDKTWFEGYFALTGEHMILTEDGWTEGAAKPDYLPEEILAEVNAPQNGDEE
jgi:hypothetical protein